MVNPAGAVTFAQTYDPYGVVTQAGGMSQSAYGFTGEQCNYELDLNTGITQVLDDGTYSYSYGLGRISQQQGTTPEYFLTDALGSVRQLVNANTNITITKHPVGTNPVRNLGEDCNYTE